MEETPVIEKTIEELQAELEIITKERAEYLDGWQRARADLANLKKESSEMSFKSFARGKEAILEDVIPALDIFDLAMQGEAWNKVDQTWRTGIETIRAQLIQVLKNNGVEQFGVVGEIFDPMLHEALQEETRDGGVPNSIIRVVRSGYKTSSRVLNAAQVIIQSA